jgi:hypothetical protein
MIIRLWTLDLRLWTLDIGTWISVLRLETIETFIATSKLFTL